MRRVRPPQTSAPTARGARARAIIVARRLPLWREDLSGGPIARIEKDVPPILDLKDADLVVERVPVLVEPEMLEGKLQVGFGKGGADCLPLGRY